MEIWQIIVAVLGGFGAGIVGSITGGGGLISIPAMLFIGTPVDISIATNKFGAIWMTLAGTIEYRRKKETRSTLMLPTTIVGTVGAAFGAAALTAIPKDHLANIIAICLIISLYFIISKKDLGEKDLSDQVSPRNRLLGYLAIFFIGFWGGFFGGGYAILAVYSFLFIFKTTLLEAASAKMPMGVGIAVVSVLIFGLSDLIDWRYGLLLTSGMVPGAVIGARIALRGGNKVIRPLLIVVVTASAIKLLTQ